MHPRPRHIDLSRVSHYFTFDVKLSQCPTLRIRLMFLNFALILGNFLLDDLYAPLFSLVVLTVLAGALNDLGDATSVHILQSGFGLKHESFLDEFLVLIPQFLLLNL